MEYSNSNASAATPALWKLVNPLCLRFGKTIHRFLFVAVWLCCYLHRKANLSLAPTANLAFRWTIAHLTPSVFHTDQRSMWTFLIRTLWPEFWQAILASMGNPNISKARDWFRRILHNRHFAQRSIFFLNKSWWSVGSEDSTLTGGSLRVQRHPS